jgi:hypothetical protein
VRTEAALESAWKKSPPSLEQWLGVRTELLEAALHEPGDPSLAETLGVLHARRAASSELLMYARDYLGESLALRPVSPYSWASYAHVKYALGQTGRPFEVAVVNAVRLGPWEPFVQRSIADLGLAVYNEVEPATRAHIRSIVEHGMRANLWRYCRFQRSVVGWT